MDKLKAFESFVSVATRGSLTAAAKAEGVAPAIMGRRLDALEEHLGVKLLVRTTRRISPGLQTMDMRLFEPGPLGLREQLLNRPLVQHDCLTLSSDASQTRGWAFRVPHADGSTEVMHLKPGGPLDCSDGQVLHDWCLGGWGIAWRSTWEVEAEIAAGRLVEVLHDYAAPPNGIYVVFPQRKHMPLRVRLWIDYLKMHYERPQFWREGVGL